MSGAQSLRERFFRSGDSALKRGIKVGPRNQRKERSSKMEEKKQETGTPTPGKPKKNLTMLIMVLALVLVVIILVIAVIVSSGKDDVTTPTGSSSTDPVGTTEPADTSEAPAVTSGTDGSTPGTSPTPVDPVDPEIYETVSKADSTGKVTVKSSDSKTGPLILVNATFPYDYNTGAMFAGGADISKADAEKAGFFRIADNSIKTFPTNGYDSFLREEALKAFAALATTFESVSGTSRELLVNGYTASHSSAFTNEYCTGLVLDVRIRSANGDTFYNFDYEAKTVTVDGKKMTYEEWFKANCGKYGFIYEGIPDGRSSGVFRYVGTINAAGVTTTLEAYLAGVKDGSIKSVTAADGSKWNLSYVAASSEENTEITVGANAEYVISGDNMGGFIVAVKAAS